MFKRRVIAVCGKGGSGKTTLVALMAKILIEDKNKKILLIDADPTAGLLYALDVKPKKTVGEVREELIRTARQVRNQAEKFRLADSVDYLLMDAIIEYNSFDLLAIGRQDGPGCFCSVNELLKQVMESIAENYDLIIIDGEAGIEQINRQVIQNVDTCIIVTDPTLRGFETAKLIEEIIESMMRSTKPYLLINKLKPGDQNSVNRAKKMNIELLGCLEEDDKISEYDSLGRPLVELPSSSIVFSVRDILEKIFEGNNNVMG